MNIPQGMTASFLTCPLLSHHLWMFPSPSGRACTHDATVRVRVRGAARLGVRRSLRTHTHTQNIILCRVFRGPLDSIQDPLPSPPPRHLPRRPVSPSGSEGQLSQSCSEPSDQRAARNPETGQDSSKPWLPSLTWASGARRAKSALHHHAKDTVMMGPPSIRQGPHLRWPAEASW